MSVSAIQFTDLTQFRSGSKGYSGVTFDGRYLYFAPLSNGKGEFFGEVARYDSQKDFRKSSSWEHFDTSGVSPFSRGFVDGIFDGRYVYLVPFHHDRHHGQVTRFDTQLKFQEPDAWAFYDLEQQTHESCRGYVSGSFDGKYLYLSPYQLDATSHHGRMVRYDTGTDFLDPGSWQSFDSQELWPESRGFHSAVSADGYTYFVPYVRKNRDYHGWVVRNRQAENFKDPSNWEAVDLSLFNSGARGYVGGCFDGHYLYLAPYYNGSERHGLVARLDIRKPFKDRNSWRFFDTTLINPNSRGFFGAIVHGPFIYFLPHCKAEGIYHGQLSRYDRRNSFDDPLAWSVFDTSSIHPKSMGFMGGVVVSGHLFMAPYETAPFAHSGLVCKLDLGDPTIWRHE